MKTLRVRLGSTVRVLLEERVLVPLVQNCGKLWVVPHK